jgi:hypothetical protein
MRHTRLFRFIATFFLGLFIFFLLRLCLPSVAFGQVGTENNPNVTNIAQASEIDIDSYSKETAEFLVRNGDETNLSVPLEKTKFEKQFQRSLVSWKRVTNRIGGIYLDLKGSLEFPKNFSLGNNEAKAQATLSVRHYGFEGAEKLPPHFQAEFIAKASDKELLSRLSRKIASAELNFRGLMLKGVPEYLEQNTAFRKLRENGMVLTRTPNNDNEAKLSKTIEVPKLSQLEIVGNSVVLKAFEASLDANKKDVLRYRKEISELETTLEQAHQENNAELVRQQKERIQTVKDKLQEVQNSIESNLANRQRILANLPLTASFTCAPEFIREFKFPIFERKVSTSTQGASGSAGVGVSGDVVIDISAPTCTVAFSPPFPFKVNSSVYSDVSVTSNGYFGAQAEGSAEQQQFGIKFTGKYGNYTVPTVTLDDKEKEAIAEIILKIADDVKNDEKVLNELANNVKNELVSPVVSAIESTLIGSDSAPFNISEICSLFTRMGATTSGSEENLVCWAASASKPIEPIKPKLPELVLPREPKIPNRPQGVCKLASSLPCIPSRTRTVPRYPCGTLRNPRWCTTVTDPEIPLGCSAARAANDRVCADIRKWDDNRTRLLQNWETEKTNVRNAWNRRVREINDSFNAEFSKWQTDINSWNRYRDPASVRNIAKKFVRSRIILSSDVIDSKAIAKQLLDLAFQVEEGGSKVNQWIDLTNKYLQTLAPGISVSASGRIAFDSRAHLLVTRPQITADAKLVFNNGKPSFDDKETKVVGYVNGLDTKEGRIGGLDQIGIKFFAKQVACLGGKVDESSEEPSCSNGKAIARSKVGKDEPWTPTKEPQGGEKLPAGTTMRELVGRGIDPAGEVIDPRRERE